jgi:type IV pilus assembly protein PilA
VLREFFKKGGKTSYFRSSAVKNLKLIKEMNMFRNQRGFTLIELVVVVIIIGVLAAASVPIYRGYIKKATLSEGRSVVGAIANAQKIYYTEYNTVWAVTPSTGFNATLGIDITSNRYFNMFDVTRTNAGPGASSAYIATATGLAGTDASGIFVTVTQVMNSFPTITDNM